jgi:hypothetical protein
MHNAQCRMWTSETGGTGGTDDDFRKSQMSRKTLRQSRTPRKSLQSNLPCASRSRPDNP